MEINQEKLALITGGSSGIGLALANNFVKQGANVWILARHSEQLYIAQQQLAQACVNPNQSIGHIRADVSDYKVLSNELNHFVDNVGIPDFLINSAGVAHPGHFEELNLNIFHWMMDINYFGTVNTTKIFTPKMIKRGYGYIVNISSIAGILGIYGYTAYGASKYAVMGFSDALRAEMKPKGIHVSLVLPPDTRTPQLEYESQYKPTITKALTESAGAMAPEAVAAAIVRGIIRERYLITPGFEGKLIYHLVHPAGKLIYLIMDILINRAQKKLDNLQLK